MKGDVGMEMSKVFTKASEDKKVQGLQLVTDVAQIFEPVVDKIIKQDGDSLYKFVNAKHIKNDNIEYELNIENPEFTVSYRLVISIETSKVEVKHEMLGQNVDKFNNSMKEAHRWITKYCNRNKMDLTEVEETINYPWPI